MSLTLSAIGSFEIFETVTVQEPYKWDDGVPLDTIVFYDLAINNPPLASSNSSGKVYVGTSPFMSVSLSSTYTPHASAVAVKRTYDFGDYYNTETNIVISTCFNPETVCHTYIMPGTYTIKMTIEEYRKAPKTIIPVGQYIQPGTSVGYPIDIYWQWRNFLCNDYQNPLNRKITWNYSEDCLCCYGWRDAIPCLCVDSCVWETTCPVVDNSVCIDPGPVCEPTTWDSLMCETSLLTSTEAKLWSDKTCITCSTHEPPSIEVVKIIYTKERIVVLAENLPTAYIDIFQDPNFFNRTSPHKVRLSARNIQPGSFPIERIDWDLGDGTPVKTQKRWAINTDSEFDFTDVFFADWKDPRNYDLIHEYKTSPGSQITFYPSLTCYSSSTASAACAKGIVGPINPAPVQSSVNSTDKKPLKLIQNELTDKGKVLLGELDCTAVIWKYDKQN